MIPTSPDHGWPEKKPPKTAPKRLSVAEWIPIRPKTDAAFLYAIVHRVLHERGWREVCDVPFLERMTASPYLVGPNGWFLRDAGSGKPLVWDTEAGAARPFDASSTSACSSLP